MGGKGGQSTNTVQNTAQTYMANPAIAGIGSQAIGQAQSAASQPFQMPQAPVANFNADQLAAFQQYRGLPGIPAPYLAQANQAYGNAASTINADSINQFYDPMASRITSNLQDVFGHQNVGTQGNLVQQAGGVGADRIAVGMGEAEKAQGSIANNAYLGAYQQALQAAQQQKQLQLGAGSGFTNLAAGATNDNLAATNAFLQSGQLQQHQAQQQLNAPYQQRLAQIAFPYQNAQFLAGITGGLAPAFGGTTVGNQRGQTTAPQPSMLSQLLGVGTAGAGLYGAFGGFSGSGKGSDAGTLNYGNLGGGTGGFTSGTYAEGGEVGEEDNQRIPGISSNDSLSPIPYIPLHGGAGHSSPLTGGVTFQQPQQEKPQDSGGGLGDVLKTAASVVPFFLKDGGPVGYDVGGGDYSPDELGSSPLVERLARNLQDFSQAQRPSGNPYAPPLTQKPSAPTFSDRFGAAFGAPAPSGPSAWDRFKGMVTPKAAAAPTDGEVNPSPVTGIPFPRPNPLQPTPAQVADAYRQPSPTAKGTDDEDVHLPTSREVSHKEIMRGMMPTASQPYPDALVRDAGQNLTRSPWMALVNAGATMAATPGPLGVSLGKGMLAGTKSLDDQRKELQTEEGVNQKAQALYQTAKAELDKYNKMGPYESGRLMLQNKELNQSDATGTNTKINQIAYRIAAGNVTRKLASDMTYNTLRTPEEKQAYQNKMLRAEYDQAVAMMSGQLGTAPAAGPPQSSAPAQTVIQNGHSYTLQPDGSYK